MDIEILESTCKAATKNAYDEFKHFINSSLWKLDDDIIDVEIDKMTESIGQGVYKRIMKTYTPTNAQLKIIDDRISYYKTISKAYGKKYALKRRSK
ncbi:hypothetical protein [Gaetbulibacter sp. PBL-D1]|uniref:hypothetical protein n=1 Tax=Gaetbulibacter sp. PBL-D1 TaxID=3422594 RepID=UPI003D2EC61F